MIVFLCVIHKKDKQDNNMKSLLSRPSKMNHGYGSYMGTTYRTTWQCLDYVYGQDPCYALERCCGPRPCD